MIELPIFLNGVYLYFTHKTNYSDWEKDQDEHALALQRRLFSFILVDFFFVAQRTLKGEEVIP